MWNFPLDAHQNYAQAQQAKTELQQSLGSQVNAPANYVIPYATQVAVTDQQSSALDQAFGIGRRKEGAFIEEPPAYHNRLLGTVLNPWNRLFGSATHMSQQEQMIKKFVDENALLSEGSEDGGTTEIGMAHIKIREKNKHEEGSNDAGMESAPLSNEIEVARIEQSDSSASETTLIDISMGAQEQPHRNEEALLSAAMIGSSIIYATLNEAAAKIIALLTLAIQPRQEQINYVQTQIARIRQA
jgi:hypothetical protein